MTNNSIKNRIMATHASAFPAFGFDDGETDMLTGILLTVLVKGKSGRDCAAYSAVVRDTSREYSYVERFAEDVAKGGNKIRKEEAEKLFNLGGLEYRE